jgi:hypothetical protein
MNEENPKINELLESVENTLNDLDELELTYKESKEKFTNELASYVEQLAVHSDSQAKRATILRELYWNKNVPVSIISDAFKITSGRVRKLAGPQIIKFPCSQNCGNIITIVAKSKSSLGSEDYYKTTWYYNVCDECKDKDKLKEEQTEINKKKAVRQRNRELYEMSWEDFMETPEWKFIRNATVHDAGYGCERCNTQPENLYIYPHRDTPQSRRNFYSDAIYKHYALCGKCIGNYEGLINAEKRDIVKKDFLPIIKKWAYESQYRY